MRKRPNILFVFPDQLSARWTGVDGHPVVRTPNLDAFARESVNFTAAYTCCPLCTPYRSALLTGLYPHQTGVTRNGQALPRGVPTLAHHLSDIGYETHYVGKWHLSGDPQENRWVPPEARGGFQHFIGWESHHVDHRDGRVWADDPDRAIDLSGHETDGLTDIVLERLEEVGEPFCMVVSYQAPHPPCSPPRRFRRPYEGADLLQEPNADPEAHYRKPAWDEDCGVADFRERYFGEITHLDAAFGRVLEALEGNGLAGDTIVVFTSDHGELAGAHGIFGKGVMYDEAVRVPLTIRVPGGEAGETPFPVSTVDFLPTLLELAGATPPKAVPGASFAAPLLAGRFPDAGRPIFIEHDRLCVVRDGLKLVADGAAREAEALYDLKADPCELGNLAGEPDRRAEAETLLGQLRRWLEETGPAGG